jgi:hypothetical protein
MSIEKFNPDTYINFPQEFDHLSSQVAATHISTPPPATPVPPASPPPTIVTTVPDSPYGLFLQEFPHIQNPFLNQVTSPYFQPVGNPDLPELSAEKNKKKQVFIISFFIQF